jgi:hypothetical protein
MPEIPANFNETVGHFIPLILQCGSLAVAGLRLFDRFSLPLQISKKENPTNWRENEMEIYGNTKISSDDQGIWTQFVVDAIPQDFALGKNMEVRHQIVARPDRAAAMHAKPRTRRDRATTSVTNPHRFRFMQCFFDFMSPRIRRSGDLPGPNGNAPQGDKGQNGQSNFADKTLRIGRHRLFNACCPSS